MGSVDISRPLEAIEEFERSFQWEVDIVISAVYCNYYWNCEVLDVTIFSKKKNKNKEKIRSGFLGEVNAEPVVEKHLVQAYPSSLSVFPPN